MLSGRKTDWDSCLSTLEGNSDSVNAIALSPDRQLGHSVSVNVIAFSPDGQLLLYTDKGAIPFSSPLIRVPASPSRQLSYLFVQDRWILCNEQPLLWLPAEYEPSRIAISEHIVCLGCFSGGVTLLKIK
ncbi:hypothetical protein GQ43DRAFT_382394 [Delitschia confertaspora ATCC 74209]|uniref:Uncharacterized protein n=1 Tax=Delitschia confertaspora ATCC 74209 TaxID=1513339 RepID=A0A9P4JHX9_9PLEO|nr:hypothetical protein GQ43DRAFT_382394 [Delitschia confertaspora ATCC 74209]